MNYLRAVCLLAAMSAAKVAMAQQAAAPQDVPSPSTSLGSEFFDHDFVNFFVFFDGTYDTALPKLTPGSSGYGSAFGFDAGGGVTARHDYKDGTLSLSYRGDYRHYFANTYSNGSDQSLSLLYTKRLSRHWTLSTQFSGGQIVYGGSFYGTGEGGSSVLANPYSSLSRFANAGINMTYQQTRRLSYTFGGQFFYSNYNFAGAVSSVGGTGTVAVNYRTTQRTTIGASYSRSYFTYGQSRGSTTIDGAFLTASHQFTDRWTLSGSAGISHTHSEGIIQQPVTFVLDGQTVTGFYVGPYNRTYNAPSFNASLSRTLRRSLISVSGGQGINAGNGTFLTSKDQYANLTYSYTRHLSNLSFGGGYTRLTSIANTVNIRYNTATASASYGFNLTRYTSANFGYTFIHYDSLYSLNGLNESRFTFGVTFSSKSVPLTLF